MMYYIASFAHQFRFSVAVFTSDLQMGVFLGRESEQAICAEKSCKII